MDWIFWLVTIIVLTVIELATVNLVTIWFIASGLITLILSFFVSNDVVLSTIFVVLGVILLITTKPILDKYLKPKGNVKTNLDRIIGSEGIVTESITKNSVGEVKVDGKKWSAISKYNIDKGETVRIIKIDGVKLLVERM